MFYNTGQSPQSDKNFFAVIYICAVSQCVLVFGKHLQPSPIFASELRAYYIGALCVFNSVSQIRSRTLNSAEHSSLLFQSVNLAVEILQHQPGVCVYGTSQSNCRYLLTPTFFFYKTLNHIYILQTYHKNLFCGVTYKCLL